MQFSSKKDKLKFQRAFLRRAGLNFAQVKQMMDALPNVGFYIKDANDRIVTLNRRNCEISALKDEFDAIGRKSSDLFPDAISRECLARDATVRKNVIVEDGISEMPAVVSITTSATSKHPVRLALSVSTPRTHYTAGNRTTPSFTPPQCPPLLRGSNSSTDHPPVAVNGTD